MEKHTVSISSLPDEFIDWMNETRKVGGETIASFLRRHMLNIREYKEYLESKELKED